ncbi:hypothetical protein GCM10027160_02810 [Streptomyces calidiresistens]
MPVQPGTAGHARVSAAWTFAGFAPGMSGPVIRTSMPRSAKRCGQARWSEGTERVGWARGPTQWMCAPRARKSRPVVWIAVLPALMPVS